MRYQSLDIFKALGIIYLICLHELGWFFTNSDGNNLRFDEAVKIVFPLGFRTGLHVLGLQIPLLAGITHYLSVRQKNLTFEAVFYRGLILMFSGYLMNFLAWGIDDIGAWDVLQFIGLSLIISYPFIKNNAGLSMLGLLGVFVLALSNQFPFPSYSESYVYKILVGDSQGFNYWPMCPWFFIFVVGIYIGKFYFEKKAGTNIFWMIGAVLFLSAVLTGHYHPGLDWDNVWGAALFKPSPLFVLGVAGFSLIAIPGVEKLMSLPNRTFAFLTNKSLLYFGKNIFWFYILSTVIGYWLTTLFVTQFPDLTFSQYVTAYIVFIVVNLIICYQLIRLKDLILMKIVKD